MNVRDRLIPFFARKICKTTFTNRRRRNYTSKYHPYIGRNQADFVIMAIKFRTSVRKPLTVACISSYLDLRGITMNNAESEKYVAVKQNVLSRVHNWRNI